MLSDIGTNVDGRLPAPISSTCTGGQCVRNTYAHGREADALLTYSGLVLLDFSDFEFILECKNRHFSTYQ